MKTRFTFLAVLILIFISCKTQKQETTILDYIIFYDNYDYYGSNDALILKGNPKRPESNSYENYFRSNVSILGKWEIIKDTLYLYPQYEYRYDSVEQMKKIVFDSIKVYNGYEINQKWLIKGDHIYDRSNYSVYAKFDKERDLGEGFYKIFANPNRAYRLRTKTKLK